MKIGGGCGWPNLLQNGEHDSTTIFRVYLETHLMQKLLHVHVLDVVACLIELKMRFELMWHREDLMIVSSKEKVMVNL